MDHDRSHLSVQGHALPGVDAPSAVVLRPTLPVNPVPAAALPYNVTSGHPMAPPPMDPA